MPGKERAAGIRDPEHTATQRFDQLRPRQLRLGPSDSIRRRQMTGLAVLELTKLPRNAGAIERRFDQFALCPFPTVGHDLQKGQCQLTVLRGSRPP
jgi:hypothetical protein